MSKNIYQQDLVYLYKLLKDVHPAFIANDCCCIKLEEYFIEANQSLSRNNISFEQFELMLAKMISFLHDSHTTIFFDSLKGVFPIIIKSFNGTLYVDAISSKYKDITGKVIAGINDRSVKQVKDIFSYYLSYENEIKRDILLAYFLNNKSLLHATKILPLDSHLEIELEDGDVVSLRETEALGVDCFRLKKTQSETTTSIPFHFMIDDMQKIGYMQFNAMFDQITYKYGCEMQCIKPDEKILKSLPVFSGFMEGLCNELVEKQIKILVIDMRYNGGGNSLLGNILLEALGIDMESVKMPKCHVRLSEFLCHQYPDLYDMEMYYEYKDKFFKKSENELIKNLFKMSDNAKKYKGKVIFLQGQYTFSSAVYFLSIIKDNHLFPIIGNCTSQPPSCYGDILPFSLPLTHIRGTISYSRFLRPDIRKNGENTLSPDQEIQYTMNDLISGVDKCRNMTIPDFIRLLPDG